MPEPEGIGFDDFEDQEPEGIDIEEYASSPEAQSDSWWNLAKDVIIQPALGIANRFTWPASVLKMGMVGEALSDLDELEEIAKREGVEFDRNKYLKDVSETMEFIPTQDLLEDVFSAKTGINLDPKTPLGKRINQFFRLASLSKGGGLKTAIKSGTIGTGTTAGLEALGVSEGKAEFFGDLASGAGHLEKSPRALSKKIGTLEQTAVKHGLPFPEYMTRETKDLITPYISDARKNALNKQLGMSSEEAIEKVIEGTLDAAQMRKAGHNLEVLYNDAYDTAINMAKGNPKIIPMNSIVSDIDAEIARRTRIAPSLGDENLKAIEILQKEKNIFEKAKPNTEQLINQIRENNSNVKEIYRKPQFAGNEEAVKDVTAFLNNSIRKTIEVHSDPAIRQVLGAGEKIFAESSRLDRVENLVSKAFQNGDYSPKKLSKLLESSQGLKVRRELGDKAVNEIRDIAKFGETAQKNVAQLAKSSKHLGNISEWGPIAGFILAKMPKTGGLLLAAKPITNRVRGYLLTNDAARTEYKNILKNAANGSFKNMKGDFKKLEDLVTKDYGSLDDFFDDMSEDLQFYDPEKD